MTERRNHNVNLEGTMFRKLTEEEYNEIMDLHRKLVRADIDGLGPGTAAKIVEKYPTHEEMVSASVDGLADIEGISDRGAEKILPSVVECAESLSIR